MEKPAQTGAVVLGELRAESPGLCCFEIRLLPHPCPTYANVPIQGRGQTGKDAN